MEKKNIIILGGAFSNKGAQAMTFTVVDQIKRRFPDQDIYLFSTEDFERADVVNRLYKFNFMPWTPRGRVKLLLGPFVKDCGRHALRHKEIKDILNRTLFIINISGYALSSQWGFSSSLGYLINIMIAKKYSIPFYILPQTFGPFDYPLIQKLILFPLLKICLNYPRKIFMRETEALRYAQKFTRSNVERHHDIVLQKTEYNLSNIYSKEISFKHFTIVPNSVCIIPNARVFDITEPTLLYAAYQSMVRILIDSGITIYILRHSEEDLKICRSIKSFFQNDTRVQLIEDDLNAIELENTLGRFDFVVASRYHSIIHSYKKGVPAIVLGWAQKYSELVREFDQAEYYFDCRNKIDIDDLNAKLSKMVEKWAHEKDKIVRKTNSISEINVFDMLKSDLTGFRKDTVPGNP